MAIASRMPDMARYKPIDTSPRFLPIDLSRQLLPGSFEHALNDLVDHELDLSGFDARYRNDRSGARENRVYPLFSEPLRADCDRGLEHAGQPRDGVQAPSAGSAMRSP